MEDRGAYIYIALLFPGFFQLDYLSTLVSMDPTDRTVKGSLGQLLVVFNSLPSAATPRGMYKPL